MFSFADLCQNGKRRYSGYCYSINEDKKDFNNAKASCKEQNAYLADINSAEENQFLEKINFDGMMLIGLNDVNHEKLFIWDHSGKKPTYTNFHGAGRQPDNFNGDEDCVEIYLNTHDSGVRGKWNDIPCSTQLPYVCKSGKVKDMQPSAMYVKLKGDLPFSWRPSTRIRIQLQAKAKSIQNV